MKNNRVQSLCLDLLVLGLGAREPSLSLWGAGWRGREKTLLLGTQQNMITAAATEKMVENDSPKIFVLTKPGKANALFFPTL